MKLLNEAQKEKFLTISGYLKQAREQKLLSREEVAIVTLVPMNALAAIDEGEIERLPEAVYVQGFIRRYGDAVGLNGRQLAAEFAEACLPVPEPVQLSEQDSSNKIGVSMSLLTPYILFVGLLAAASFGLYYILNPQRGVESAVGSASRPKNQKTSQKNFPTTSPTTSPTNNLSVGSNSRSQVSPTPFPSVTSTPLTSAKPQLTSQSTSIPLPSPTSTPLTSEITSEITSETAQNTETSSLNDAIKIKLDIQEEAWVRVKVDGKTEFEGILKPGEVKNWSGNQEISLESGNAGGVMVSQNDQPAQPLGEKYAVVRKKYEATPTAIATPNPN